MFVLFASLLGADPSGPVDEEEVLRLVRAVGQQNRPAARRLYGLYVARVFRVARPLCDSDAEAEDVVQDTFLRAFERIHRFAPRRDSRFAAWLCTIALNLARKRRRSAGRLDALSPGDLPGADSPADEAEQAGRRAALLAALAELPERDRRVVTLCYGAELTAAEVGEACGVSEANVRKICERQRKSLLSKLGGSAPGEAA
ncbi:MAG: RNA polymerase sigma factor [Myxococcaceae bacterium]